MAKPSKPTTAHKAWVLIVCLAAALAWSTAMTNIPTGTPHTSAGNSHYHGTHNEEALHD